MLVILGNPTITNEFEVFVFRHIVISASDRFGFRRNDSLYNLVTSDA